ncbi:MAG: hypothetical protein COA88_03005 [Kordia sp.]|nr:MAG: hypothetical protein COA88_03005 [Kordia sp.]
MKKLIIIIVAAIVLIGVSIPIVFNSIADLNKNLNPELTSKYVIKIIFGLAQVVFLLYIIREQVKK